MLLKKTSIFLVSVLINISIFATQPYSNFVSLNVPSGSGYIWCNAQPLAKKSEKAAELIKLTEKNLQSNAAYIATNCIDVSGMECGDWSDAASGTLTTDMWWLQTHYLRYEKSGQQFNQDDPTCENKDGNVQIRVDYDYRLRCYISKTPPQELLPVNKPAC